jgi:hypothetical protein
LKSGSQPERRNLHAGTVEENETEAENVRLIAVRKLPYGFNYSRRLAQT